MNREKTYEVLPINVAVPSNLQTINFYLIKFENSLILVDAGIAREDFYESLLHTLRQHGLTLSDITEIILTHNHGDHVGLVNYITKQHHVPVYTHSEAFPRLKRDPEFFHMRTNFFAKLYEEMGCGDEGKEQVAYLREAMEKNKHQAIEADLFPVKMSHFGFQTIHTPGHAPDHIALYHDVTKELFAGDLLIKHISSNALIEPDQNGRRIQTLLQHIQSMEKIKKLPVTCTYSGHGEQIVDTKQLIDRRFHGIERKANHIKKLLIEEKRLTAADLAKSYYKELYEKQFSLVMSEIIGHLDYLEEKKEVIKERINGVWYYTVS